MSFRPLMMACLMSVFSLHAGASADWSYSFPTGPYQWGGLPGFSSCSQGSSQSPVAIDDPSSAGLPTARPDASLTPLEVRWTGLSLPPSHNGHTVEVSYAKGSQLTFQGQAYELQQFHFHSPSEHVLNGQFYPMEVHFVHKDASGKLLVVGVFVKEGAWNREIAEVFEAGNPVVAANLLPQELGLYSYQGSLTTPPCSEGVSWVVLKTPIEASKEQVRWLQKKNGGANNRPLQSLEGRVVKMSVE